MDFATDHRPVWANFQFTAPTPEPMFSQQGPRAPLSWKPGPTWNDAAACFDWNWTSNWSDISSKWCELATLHQLRKSQRHDTTLMALLHDRKCAATPEKRRRPGKGSPDGCTAELFHGLPKAAVCSLAVFFTCVMLTLQIPHVWTQGKATLIPKTVAPASLDKYRGIACLTAARKLLGYLILAMLPDLVFFSVQCCFVPHRQAAEGVCRIKRILEMCREWNRSVHVVQIDLSKAFDRVFHSSVLQALRLQSCLS